MSRRSDWHDAPYAAIAAGPNDIEMPWGSSAQENPAVVSVYDVANPASHAPLLVFPDRGSGRTTRKGGRRR